jgi:hypothetical protein
LPSNPGGWLTPTRANASGTTTTSRILNFNRFHLLYFSDLKFFCCRVTCRRDFSSHWLGRLSQSLKNMSSSFYRCCGRPFANESSRRSVKTLFSHGLAKGLASNTLSLNLKRGKTPGLSLLAGWRDVGKAGGGTAWRCSRLSGFLGHHRVVQMAI